MSPKTKFNLLLEADQIAALREIQSATGAAIAEQIRRAIADWILKRGSRELATIEREERTTQRRTKTKTDRPRASTRKRS